MSYIEREALKAVFEEDGHLSAYVEEMIDSIPAADVRPVVRGKWTDDSLCSPDGRWGLRGFKCSVCGGFCIGEVNFCPNCGARMCNEEEQT